ncbi:MAG TPA: DUF5752 family protein [Thermodesulfobacteriota bacterium]|nr:DUF5752 family protein [Thermodesulfobacteriota bacterium]
MNTPKTVNPFFFSGCWELKEMLGRTARDEQQLLEIIEDLPLESIYYHTHSFFLRHKYIAGPYPNDFATWAAIQVRDKVLGEKLGILSPFDYNNLEGLRIEIVSIIEEHLSKLQIIPRAVYGEPFYFMQSRIVENPTGLSATSLDQFREILSITDPSVVYYHTFEAILRLQHLRGDFPVWIGEQLGLHELAKAISQLDLYMSNLESIRQKIITLCDVAVEKGEEK